MLIIVMYNHRLKLRSGMYKAGVQNVSKALYENGGLHPTPAQSICMYIQIIATTIIQCNIQKNNRYIIRIK